MSALAAIEIGVVLWLVHVLLQASLGTTTLPTGYLFTPRDAPAQARGAGYGRATRALANYIENFAPFAALDLAFLATNQAPGFGALLWIACRVVYIPIYMLGVVYARTAIWALSVVGLVMMFVKLAF